MMFVGFGGRHHGRGTSPPAEGGTLDFGSPQQAPADEACSTRKKPHRNKIVPPRIELGTFSVLD